MLITQFTPLLGNAASDTGMVWLAVAAIISPICSVLGIWLSARRSPPLAEAVAKEFARAETMNKLADDTKADIIRIYSKIDTLSSNAQSSTESAAQSRGHMISSVENLQREIQELRGWLVQVIGAASGKGDRNGH